jgi:hypothetical protein
MDILSRQSRLTMTKLSPPGRNPLPSLREVNSTLRGVAPYGTESSWKPAWRPHPPARSPYGAEPGLEAGTESNRRPKGLDFHDPVKPIENSRLYVMGVMWGKDLFDNV